MSFYVRKVLDDESMNQIDSLIAKANEDKLWIGGLVSGGGTSSVKHNMELNCPDTSIKINNIIMSALDFDADFLSFTAAKTSTTTIISKTGSGGYYNPHLDNWFNGDFSTTLFLSDPSTYIGGELCLLLDDDSEMSFKLEKGHAITYSTGIVHRVNKVISGNRYAAVFWTHSHFKDSFHRYIYQEINKLGKLIPNDPMHYSTCEAANKDPSFIIDSLKMQLIRRYSR